jgi:hypothetical protein
VFDQSEVKRLTSPVKKVRQRKIRPMPNTNQPHANKTNVACHQCHRQYADCFGVVGQPGDTQRRRRDRGNYKIKFLKLETPDGYWFRQNDIGF